MREIDLKEIKKRQLDLLILLKEFCDKHNIDYFLDCGTLLGAVRHKGFIPWDDDIDVGMTRDNFNKFIDLFNKEMSSTNYRAYTYQNNKNFYFAYAKLCDITTTLYEHGQTKYKQFINIDIFVYDKVPYDKASNIFKKREKYLRLNRLKNFQDFKNDNLVKKLTYIALLPLSKDHFIKKLDNMHKKYLNIGSDYIADIASFDDMLQKVNVLEPYKELEFEGILFKVPNDTDKWLKGYFNDYMTLPPVEKRVECHHFKAYLND